MFERSKTWFKPYVYLGWQVVIILCLLSLFRVIFLQLWSARMPVDSSMLTVLTLGLRADASLLGYLMAPLLLVQPLWWRWQKHWQRLVQVWFMVWGAVIILMELVTPPFTSQFDSRPQRIFFEYLVYPQEIMTMMWKGFRLELMLVVLLGGLLIWGWVKLSRYGYHRWCASGSSWSLFGWLPMLVLVLLMARGTLAHRPVNPGFFATTQDQLINSLTVSSTYQLAYILYSMRHEAELARVYGDMPAAEILARVAQVNFLTFDDSAEAALPTLHYQPATAHPSRPQNIIIVLEESLGATFVKSLGGLGVTPELEQWRYRGWWFEQMYATGIRSVRGIEAVLTGFLPTPARSVVKLPNAQHDFFTLAQVLAEQGYHTQFIYGGNAHFDNMKQFMLGNGFQQVIEQKDFVAPEFVGSWGVSDEDLFDYAQQELERQHQAEKPFFTLIFTSSNHEPFDYPTTKIEPYALPFARVENAVKYADYALGEFLQQASESAYWQNSIILVVADHDSRVYGDALVPVNKFHIPALILGGSVAPRVTDAITSQIDLPPTLLSLAGVSAAIPTIGQDLTRTDVPPANRAPLQFNQNFGWLTPQQLVVLQPQQPAQCFTFNGQQLGQAIGAAECASQDALAHALLPGYLYRTNKYRLPLQKDGTFVQTTTTQLPIKP